VRRRPSSRSLLAASVLTITLILSSAGTSLASLPTTTDVLPAPEELPARTVAVVSHVPVRSRTVTARELGHTIVQVAWAAGLKSPQSASQPQYKRLEQEALAELLDGLWIEGQAVEMGISVPSRRVSIELAQIKRENFKSRKQFYAFIKHAHFTLRDIRYRVELRLLATQINERAARGARTQKELHEKLSAFVDVYKRRWRSRTVCAPRYAIGRCSNS
jgi:hypothetical protein